jgi:Immunity protein 30
MKKVIKLGLEEYLKSLYKNRLMESETEIHDFELSLSKVLEYKEIRAIEGLCLAFDDDTNQFEIMFGLIHGIEGLYKSEPEEGLKMIANSTPIIYDRAIEWVEILHYRILNHPQVRIIYSDVLSKIEPNTSAQIKKLLIDIKNEDPDQFRDAVNEVINAS